MNLLSDLRRNLVGRSRHEERVPATEETGVGELVRGPIHELRSECGLVRRNGVKAEEKLFGEGEISELLELARNVSIRGWRRGWRHRQMAVFKSNILESPYHAG